MLLLVVSHGKSPVTSKFSGHGHCGSGDMMLLVVEGKNSTQSFFNPPLPFISKVHSISCSHTQNFRT